MQPLPDNIFLIGLMGAGKTSVGRQLALRLGKTFCDADAAIEARCGVKVSVIFDVEGEAGFRRREAEIIAELTSRSGVVVATGGGAILHPQSRTYLRTRGTAIYLAASLSDLWARTRHDRNRPLLQTASPRETLERLLHDRDPLYREVAHLVITTGRPSVQKLTETILDALARNQGQIASPGVNQTLVGETH